MESKLNYYTLRSKLKKLGVSEDYYSIGIYGEEALCIVYENDRWCIFEGERGNRYAVEFFNDEAEACLRFVERIKVVL